MLLLFQQPSLNSSPNPILLPRNDFFNSIRLSFNNIPKRGNQKTVAFWFFIILSGHILIRYTQALKVPIKFETEVWEGWWTNLVT